MEKRRIVCAAVSYPKRPDVLPVGPRHFDKVMHDQYMRFFSRGTALGEEESVQGFIDQHGKFLTREEAWVVAEAAGQILRRYDGDTTNGGRLFSDNLY